MTGPAPQIALDLGHELVVDLFAGGGGTSLGLEWGLGRAPDIAVNHDAQAIAMHQANHPETDHFCESVFKVNPARVTRGLPVGLLWASPDCTHHSKAKGGKPVSKKLRGLAWVVVKWARCARPRRRWQDPAEARPGPHVRQQRPTAIPRSAGLGQFRA